VQLESLAVASQLAAGWPFASPGGAFGLIICRMSATFSAHGVDDKTFVAFIRCLISHALLRVERADSLRVERADSLRVERAFIIADAIEREEPWQWITIPLGPEAKFAIFLKSKQ